MRTGRETGEVIPTPETSAPAVVTSSLSAIDAAVVKAEAEMAAAAMVASVKTEAPEITTENTQAEILTTTVEQIAIEKEEEIGVSDETVTETAETPQIDEDCQINQETAVDSEGTAKLQKKK